GIAEGCRALRQRPNFSFRWWGIRIEHETAAINSVSLRGAMNLTRKRSTHLSRLLPLVVILGSLSPIGMVAAAEDWTQFRGPNGSGVSASTGLPVEFGPTKNVIWKTALPAGHSSPVLAGDRIFVTAHAGEKQAYKLEVFCLERKTGKILWQRD